MSTVYATEPLSSGHVVLETTHGPLDVQLWCHECPTACRLFLQLCLDNFYDNVVWHRIIPNFLIQTGAIRRRLQQRERERDGGTVEERLYYDDALALELSSRSNQATSSALQKEIRQQTMRNYRLQVGAENALARQRFEIHPRLRFQRRGLLAVALPVQDHA